MKKIFHIFYRDLRISLREFIAFWIMVAPICLAVVVMLILPGIANTPLHIGMVGGQATEQAGFFGRFAEVEHFRTLDELEKRVMGRDDLIGVVTGDGESYLLTQGNEMRDLVQGVAMLKTYYESGVTDTAPNFELHDFGRTAPPVKTMLFTSLLVLITVLSGMLVAINLVEEKEDKTIRILRAAPLPMLSYVIGKNLIGVFNTVVCSVVVLLIAGFLRINFLQILLVTLGLSLISFIIGFLTGLTSDDFISAASAIKILMLPAFAPILAVELLDEKWWKFFYWSPFYWAYDALKSVVGGTATWGHILLNTGIIAAFAAVIYIVLRPRIKKRFA